MTAAIYDAIVTHTRTERLNRTFQHRIYLWLVDLDDPPRLPAPLRPFARFDARDHLGDPAMSIKDNLADWLVPQGIEVSGRVLMLASARVLGYVFNPITVYWVHDSADRVVCVVAEVHNTYGGRHRYLLHTDDRGRARADKEFYVSPFLELGGTYRMRLPRPGAVLSLTVALSQGGKTPFTATLVGDRRRATTAEVLRTVVRRPLMPQRVSALIRRHGIALWLRRVPVIPRPAAPSPVAQERVR
ncbi:hypothetical protein SAMN05192558_112181 [Actinokineospora alba]|uniref:DUF1365 domain-containing protein n=1 Tax=Actinokineospora alba TaxID=504798 RepID=A0A1H0V0A4_9PSEU|nr:hypothetical protein C8E96_4520 [Actinokineospora alba]SDI75979.1 hypothetical protein SAMN05421871_107223 [Actinokineospora alba]SDP71773.1 hypothetical protein SAMN05192558_112181 [Actinokineospora alba]